MTKKRKTETDDALFFRLLDRLKANRSVLTYYQGAAAPSVRSTPSCIALEAIADHGERVIVFSIQGDEDERFEPDRIAEIRDIILHDGKPKTGRLSASEAAIIGSYVEVRLGADSGGFSDALHLIGAEVICESIIDICDIRRQFTSFFRSAAINDPNDPSWLAATERLKPEFYDAFGQDIKRLMR